MKIKNKKSLFAILLFVLVVIYFSWLFFRPVEVIAVHQRNNFSAVLVNNFPLTEQGKISWWMKNKDMLKIRYGIPKPASYGSFTITFWLFGDGYKEEGKYDRLCFDDMDTKINCIEKDAVFSVNNDSRNRIHFTTYGGNKYVLKENGEVVKYEYK
ncbi:Enterobacterial putative membrane protein (DUF943) [Serratia rubidaea]|uniref:Enterobacterial putative membrane protein (DUF943) n=1 Tax=Serratia rubidaea TaxID=61652 RepID=A0A447QRP7_SERRU|nr:DUF943 family protein [Serratia rubidaea]MCR0999162.1 DUF943 family protein [Serratia rubidaea]VEA72686.1 Enterobacterial putative membrane protein (DUF943) [Serratia rubidaea]